MREEKRIDEILEQRQEIYGDAGTAFTKIGRIWGALLDCDDIPNYKVALMLDALKSVRLVHSPAHRDSLDDKLGYLRHYREIIENES